MNNIKEFLKLYKDYETLIRNKGLDCKNVEDVSDETTGSRLRMCRLFRNYLSHQNDPGFLEVSDSMLHFLEDQTLTLIMEKDILQKHLKRPVSGTCSLSDKCTDVLQKMIKMKNDKIVVKTIDGYGIATIYDVSAKVMESKTKKMSEVKLSKNFVLLSPLTEMPQIPKDKIIICTSNGAIDGKLIGVYYGKG